jgi:dTDP-4-amino-4,6-dideoxygalactose transaminase
LPHERDRILTNVRAQGIEVQIGTVAIHREPVFKDARLQGDMVNSSLLADRLLALPLHHGLDEEDLLAVCSVLKSELNKH